MWRRKEQKQGTLILDAISYITSPLTALSAATTRPLVFALQLRCALGCSLRPTGHQARPRSGWR